MKKLFVGLLALGSLSAFADETKIEVTCWNNSGAQILKTVARQLYTYGTNRDSVGSIRVFTTSDGNADQIPDYVIYNGSCLAKKL